MNQHLYRIPLLALLFIGGGLLVYISLLIAIQPADAASNRGACTTQHINTQDFCTITAPSGKTLTIKINEGYDMHRIAKSTFYKADAFMHTYINDQGTPNNTADDTTRTAPEGFELEYRACKTADVQPGRCTQQEVNDGDKDYFYSYRNTSAADESATPNVIGRVQKVASQYVIDNLTSVRINPQDGAGLFGIGQGMTITEAIDSASFYYFGVFGQKYADLYCTNPDQATGLDRPPVRNVHCRNKIAEKNAIRAAMRDGACTMPITFRTESVGGAFTETTKTIFKDNDGTLAACLENAKTPGLIWEKEASTFNVETINSNGTTVDATTTYYVHDEDSPFWGTARRVEDVITHRDPVTSTSSNRRTTSSNNDDNRDVSPTNTGTSSTTIVDTTTTDTTPVIADTDTTFLQCYLPDAFPQDETIDFVLHMPDTIVACMYT